MEKSLILIAKKVRTETNHYQWVVFHQMHLDYTICMVISVNGNDWYDEYNIDEKMNPKGQKQVLKVIRGCLLIRDGDAGLPAGWRPPANRGAGLSFRIVKDE
jgi:hypothetical protein